MRSSTAVLLLFATVLPSLVSAGCPNSCSRQGICSTDGRYRCSCFTGFTGADCSLKTCPTGKAWVGYATAVDQVHESIVECSGVGDCNRATGLCSCYGNFTGMACERMGCPTSSGSSLPCSGRGLCMTMRQAALGYDGVRLKQPPSTYNLWDADKIQGCICDNGWFGADCSNRTCALGDDPLTTGQVQEIQTLSCTCGTTCSGSLVVSYAGKSKTVLYSAVATIAEETGSSGSGSGAGESLESVLESLVSQDTFATITYASGQPGDPLCSNSGNAATITFNKGAGNALPLAASYGSLSSTSNVRTVYITTTQAGTTESVQCSNRGSCDSSTGACTCFTGYGASDGNGNAGSIPDCPSAITSTSSTAKVCGGRGTCSGAPSYTCSCYQGYTGAACEHVLCPLAPAWHDEATADNTAHALSECSNRGICNRWSGTCKCAAGFSGAACERTSCPTTDADKPCSGNGRCLPLRQLAELGTFDGAPKGNLEVQSLTCTITSGTFTLSYLFSTTVNLSPSASAANLKAAIEALPNVGFVDVTLSGGATQICGSGAGVTALVTFTSDLGPQQLLVAAASGGATGGVTVARVTAGSRATYGSLNSGLVSTTPSTWDADMLWGCHCDGYPDYNKTSPDALIADRGAWEGPACTRRTCPYGSDPEGPKTGDASAALAVEVQSITCSATSGTFTLTFRGATTSAIAATADADKVKVALESLATVGIVDVKIGGGATAVCSNAGGGVVTSVSFTTELGNIPAMTADGSGLTGGTVTIATVTDGNGTNEECSGRGLCGGLSLVDAECLRVPIMPSTVHSAFLTFPYLQTPTRASAVVSTTTTRATV
jgi:EGF-like domain